MNQSTERHRPPSPKQQQKLVDKWNATYSVGQAVTVRKDLDVMVETHTRSLAQLLSGHTAVIWLDGISGCYDLSRVTPRVDSASPDRESA